MEEKQTCENCKYFIPHYVKHGSSLNAVNCGSCNHYKLTLTQKRKRLRAGVCGLWEQNEPAKKEERESVEKVIVQIAEQLSVIAAILKKDQP